jgi:hypothetical protein
MNAKEKAEELVYKYEYLVIEYELKDMKQCALIAVDEIIEDLSFLWLHNAEFEEQLDTREKYWQEVKQEIEKL